jgi:hypothetical protein
MQIQTDSIHIERRVVWRIQTQTRRISDASWYQLGNAMARFAGARHFITELGLLPSSVHGGRQTPAALWKEGVSAQPHATLL